MGSLTHLIGLSKPRNISKWLSENCGGIWKYDRHCGWWCDDGKRHLMRCAALAPRYDGDDETFSTEYWLYGDGTPQRIYFFRK
jgi:hypothetical protein